MMKKHFYSGFGIIGILALIASMAATHTAVGVASCGYCKMKTVAEVQSDALDKVAVNDSMKTAIIVADNKIHIDKVKADAVVAESFANTYKMVNAYAEKDRPNNDGKSITNANDGAVLFASLLKRYDKTAAHYRMATNTLISNDSARVGGRQADRHRQGFIGSTGYTASRAIAEGGKQLYGFGRIGAGSAGYT